MASAYFGFQQMNYDEIECHVDNMAGREWNGFSEEDIKRIQMNGDCKNEITNNTTQIKPVKTQVRKGILKKTKYMSENLPVQDDITPKQRLSKPKVEFVMGAADPGKNDLNKVCSENENLTKTANSTEEESISKPNVKHVTIHEEKNTFRQDNILEQFEQRQKQMEQENAKRKSLLTKAIADRKKRTEAEAQKLIKIQKELNHLDSLLSVDVSILRNQIEIASMEFTEAQKRYQKAEKEFVVAKLELFQKMQHKEKLTEHLCAIIEQNEERKAQKLVELMQQLEMDSLIETNVNGIGNVLPQLCALNNIDYSLCTTLKPPCVGNLNNDSENNTQADEATEIKNSSHCNTSNIEASNETKCDNCETNNNESEISITDNANCNDITK